jgi:hypothetical protein
MSCPYINSLPFTLNTTTLNTTTLNTLLINHERAKWLKTIILVYK